MERAEWLLLMNVKCKLVAMGGGFTVAISQALFPEVCSQTLALQQSLPPPRRGVFGAVQKSGCGKSDQIGNEKRASVDQSAAFRPC
jgi:hypothetical protein